MSIEENCTEKDWSGTTRKKKFTPGKVVIVTDTSYFWKRENKFGVMVFRARSLKRNILEKKIPYETIVHYQVWIQELQREWREVQAIASDGRNGIFKAFPGTPMQMCQRHQAEIIRRYLGKKTRILANKWLLAIADSLTKATRHTFKRSLEDWIITYKDFLDERNKHKKFKHTRTRSAYRSLVSHQDVLFTYQDYQWQIDIPNTTNTLESEFGWVKNALSIHRWLKTHRKWKVIQHYLSSR